MTYLIGCLKSSGLLANLFFGFTLENFGCSCGFFIGGLFRGLKTVFESRDEVGGLLTFTGDTTSPGRLTFTLRPKIKIMCMIITQ